ncbi:protein-histidine pros-kinase [Andreprevotia lacus DSM 23236]|uniref:histidine kinase n=1 Tax=Andreprevotia lacus DSM 23236 TaxID=1121001 RepID=A0A1W1Y0K3_9NEIS|nr:ATP-binding protein [Andreprevotia lacus]SMC29750.1 protein-histidine pros-kinase [Andreprevotia lacus DSM 23236]
MRRLIPDTFFARLFVLFFVGLIASHLLGSVVFFTLAPQAHRPPPHRSEWVGPPPPVGHMQDRPPPPEFHFPPRILQAPPMRHPIVWLDQLIRLLVLALTAWIGARWLSKPMSRLSDAAVALGQNLQSPPLAPTGPAEARHTADAFNRMQAQLRAQIDERSRFLAAVSHDLRTPLTRLRLRCEAIEAPELRERVQIDLAEMNGMLTATLDYLRGQAQPEGRQLLDIAALVHSLADDLDNPQAPLRVSGEAQAIHAQPVALKRCLNNLLENAQRYGNGAEVHIIDSRDECCIEIHDHGPGLPDNQLEAVFAPFYRIDDSRNRQTGGVGLGLSIARDIALAHGGSLTLHNAQPEGLIATLVLPRQRPH